MVLFFRLLFLPVLAVIASSSGESLKKASDDQPPDLWWLQSIFREDQVLKNTPEIVSRRSAGDDVVVTIRNSGNTRLRYSSVGSSGIQLFQEIDLGGKWQSSSWDWCGMGKESFYLNAGETVELRVRYWDTEHRERMLGHFIEEGTFISGMIVLATEE
ncbi:hypothetical protein [Gimesia sp.]|uniref:hypothetical protein n=1 Tax=Gimesia sp. TaxID=2024833 RepID=UPI003A8F2763